MPSECACAVSLRPPARFFFISQNGGECPTLPTSAQTQPQHPLCPCASEHRNESYRLLRGPFAPPSLPPMARAVPYSSRSAATPPCRPAPFLCRGEDIRLGDGMHQSLCGLHGCGWPAGSTVHCSTGARHRAVLRRLRIPGCAWSLGGRAICKCPLMASYVCLSVLGPWAWLI